MDVSAIHNVAAYKSPAASNPDDVSSRYAVQLASIQNFDLHSSFYSSPRTTNLSLSNQNITRTALPKVSTMAPGLLFITAPSADSKLINRFLLYLRDWEYGAGDAFHLITSRSIKDTKWDSLDRTSPPIDEESSSLKNEWVGASLADVEAFCIEVDKSQGKNKAHQFVVLDEDGVIKAAATKKDEKDEGAQKTCILAERVIDWDSDPIAYPEKFNKARTPWYQTYLVWCNLDIANMSWDEYMAGEEGDEEGWWVFDGEDGGEYLSEEKREVRAKEIERFKREGKA